MDGWEIVREVESDPEAALIAGALENAGIPVEVDSRLFRQEPVRMGLLGTVRILVPTERLAEAKSCLVDLEADRGAPTLSEETGTDS